MRKIVPNSAMEHQIQQMTRVSSRNMQFQQFV